MLASIARTPTARQSSRAARAGAFSMPAVYGVFVDKWPLGAFMEKGPRLKTAEGPRPALRAGLPLCA